MPPGHDQESTTSLLGRVRTGDEDARTRLVVRYLALMRRWAHGRLPPRARGLVDPDDLVQTTLMRALNGVERFEPRREGAFLAYLRKILLNEVRAALRRVDHGPRLEPLPAGLRDPRPSPLEAALGQEASEAYHSALLALSEEQREAVAQRLEMGFSYSQVAEATASPTAEAARKLVSRALIRLSVLMDEHAGGRGASAPGRGGRRSVSRRLGARGRGLRRD